MDPIAPFDLLHLALFAAAIFVAVRALTAARPERTADLERTLQRLARRVAALEGDRRPTPERTAPPATEPVAPAPVARVAPAPAPVARAPIARTPSRSSVRERSDANFENFLGGRILLFVGVVVVLFGLAFFLKFAIDRGWITPAARIAMGLVAGVALLIGGELVRRREFDVFGQSLMGCGLGALYLTNFFACTRYSFISVGVAFGGTAVITIAGSGLALLRRAPALAWLGFLGGYLAPALLAPGSSELVHLTAWLLWVDAGVLAVLLFRDWQGLDLLALLFSVVYFAGWLARHETHEVENELATVCGCLAALVATALATGIAPPVVRRAPLPEFALLGLAGAGFLSVIAAAYLLYPDHRGALAGGVVALSLAYLGAARLVARRVPGGKGAAEGLLGFAAAALTTAAVVATRGLLVAPLLSLLGVSYVLAGTRTRHPSLLVTGVATVAIAGGDLLLNRLELFERMLTPFLNERFLVFASPCAALMVAGWIMTRGPGASPAAGSAAAAVGTALLPAILAADWMFGLTPADPADVARRCELMLVAPTIALAAYGLAAAHLFGRLFERGRGVAIVPLLAALAFATSLLFDGHRREFAFLLNPTFAAGIAVVAAAGLATISAQPGARATIRMVALLYLLALLTAEIDAWGRTVPLEEGSREEALFRATVWISISWAIEAALLVAAGIWRRRPALRWTGLALFALTLSKVVLVEMAQLAPVYRIGSFLVLGALLVTASFLYQRASALPAKG